jgi:hypothetical protein
MSGPRPISAPKELRKFIKNLSPPSSFGRTPRLEWLAIAQLVVDPEYQRNIGKKGRKNICRIAETFDWSKFTPVVVAPAGSSKYTIVDGQHRTTAALILGLDKVPCAIIEASRAEQAAAFAAINANVTQMDAMQVHAAKLAAGDKEAMRLTNVCKAAGVTILRYPLQTSKQKVGETMAVGTLRRLLGKFGDEVLECSLSCITRTRDGYPGLIRVELIEALCVVLKAEPAWCEHRKLLTSIGTLDLRKLLAAAWSNAATAGSRRAVITHLVDVLSAHLEETLSEVAA